VSNYDHANIWLNLSAFWGIHSFFFRGLDHLNEKMTITLFVEKKLETGFHIVTKVFFVEEEGFQAHENSLQVRYLLSKRRVFRFVSILSR
jgi:hypothetical protein